MKYTSFRSTIPAHRKVVPQLEWSGRMSRRAGDGPGELWRAVQRRGMVAGVLAALTLAVLAPHSGWLHAQYVRYVPLSYIYYRAGRRGGGARGGGRAGARLLLVGCAHAALAAPALAMLLLLLARLPAELVQGVLISSVGSGCGWLSLALCREAAAAPLVAACYLLSLFTTPLAMFLLCGRAVLPAPSAVAGTCASALVAFGAGAACGASFGAARGPGEADGADGAEGRGERAARLCALALLYLQCCDALALRGSVRVGDLFAALLFELGWLALGLGACWVYARCGLLTGRDARTLALCAVPKGAHVGWHSALACGDAALARLPAVLLAPAQALLLAAVAAPLPAPLSAPISTPPSAAASV